MTWLASAEVIRGREERKLLQKIPDQQGSRRYSLQKQRNRQRLPKARSRASGTGCGPQKERGADGQQQDRIREQMKDGEQAERKKGEIEHKLLFICTMPHPLSAPGKEMVNS